MPENDTAAVLRWEVGELRRAMGTFRFYRTLLAIAVGVTLYSVAVNGILIPDNLFPTGISGLAVMWFYRFGWPSVAVTYAIINIPLFVLGWREYALKYVVITLFGVALFSVSLELTRELRFQVEDPLISAVLAGVLAGAGSGFYLRLGGSAGGLDILGTLIKKRFSIPIGTVFTIVNGFNLVGAWLIFDLNVALYSAVFMWVYALTVDKVQAGFSQRRAVLIITTQPEEVARQVMRRLDRGVTFFHATGGFSHDREMAVYSVVNALELGRLKDLLYEVDPEAFVVVYETSEVIGGRFLTWEDEGYTRPVRRKTGGAAAGTGKVGQ